MAIDDKRLKQIIFLTNLINWFRKNDEYADEFKEIKLDIKNCDKVISCFFKDITKVPNLTKFTLKNGQHYLYDSTRVCFKNRNVSYCIGEMTDNNDLRTRMHNDEYLSSVLINIAEFCRSKEGLRPTFAGKVPAKRS